MRERLLILFWEDRPARMKMYAWTFAFSLLFGLTLHANGVSRPEVAAGVTAVCVMMLSLSTVLYCAFTHKKPELHPQRHVTRRSALAGSITLTAIAMGKSTEELEAAVINRRLQRYESSKALDPSTLEALMNALEYTQKNRLPIDPSLLARVGRTLSVESVRSNLYSQPVHAAIESIANTQSLVRPPRETTVASASTEPPTPGVKFIDSLFVNVKVNLDGLFVENSEFRDCTILYNGGPLRLVRCLFTRCQFHISNVPNGRHLLSELSESNLATLVVES